MSEEPVRYTVIFPGEDAGVYILRKLVEIEDPEFYWPILSDVPLHPVGMNNSKLLLFSNLSQYIFTELDPRVYLVSPHKSHFSHGFATYNVFLCRTLTYE